SEHTGRQAARRNRWADPATTLLPGMGQWLVPESHRRFVAHAGDRRPSLSGKMTRKWCGLQHARVPGGIPLQGECSHGLAECLPRLVDDFRSSLGNRYSRSSLGLLVRMITGAHERAGLDMTEAKAQRFAFQILK